MQCGDGEECNAMTEGKRFWYLATPYSNYAAGHDAAYDLALACAACLMWYDYVVFSPIIHSHPIAKRYNMKTDWKFWERFDYPMMASAHGIIVGMGHGWEKSAGIAAEIEHFKLLGKPIRYLDIGTWEVT